MERRARGSAIRVPDCRHAVRMRTPDALRSSPSSRQLASAIATSLVAITVIVLGCRWLWESVGLGVFAVLAIAVPCSMPVMIEALEDEFGWRKGSSGGE